MKNHAFFKGLSWTLVKNKKMTPPEFIEAEENFDDDDFCSMVIDYIGRLCINIV